MSDGTLQIDAKVTVFVLWAASYTGATWISFVLGSHSRVFSLGNIKRALTKLSGDPAGICVVHREACTLWPGFVKRWDSSENLLLQLAQHTGCDHIVVNNPRLKGGREVVNDSRLELRQFAVQRDLRALAASYMRKNDGVGIERAINDYLLTAADTMETDVNRQNVVVIDHGIAATNHDYLLEKLRLGTGLDYDTDNLRFWEHDYHVVSSNAGTAGTVRAYQNMTDAHRQKYYDDFVSRLRREGGRGVTFQDQRWRKELSRYDLYVIDRCVGQINERLGYERDVFSASEAENFSNQLDARLKEPSIARIRRHLATKGSLYATLLHSTKHKLRELAERFR